MEIVRRIGGNEGEIEIAQVVIDRSPTREPAHHDDAVFLHVIDVDFLHRDLVAPDDDGWLVNIEEQDVFFRRDVLDQKFFDRQVDPRIVVGFVFNK